MSRAPNRRRLLEGGAFNRFWANGEPMESPQPLPQALAADLERYQALFGAAGADAAFMALWIHLERAVARIADLDTHVAALREDVERLRAIAPPPATRSSTLILPAR